MKSACLDDCLDALVDSRPNSFPAAASRRPPPPLCALYTFDKDAREEQCAGGCSAWSAFIASAEAAAKGELDLVADTSHSDLSALLLGFPPHLFIETVDWLGGEDHQPTTVVPLPVLGLPA